MRNYRSAEKAPPKRSPFAAGGQLTFGVSLECAQEQWTTEVLVAFWKQILGSYSEESAYGT